MKPSRDTDIRTLHPVPVLARLLKLSLARAFITSQLPATSTLKSMSHCQQHNGKLFFRCDMDIDGERDNVQFCIYDGTTIETVSTLGSLPSPCLAFVLVRCRVDVCCIGQTRDRSNTLAGRD